MQPSSATNFILNFVSSANMGAPAVMRNVVVYTTHVSCIVNGERYSTFIVDPYGL